MGDILKKSGTILDAIAAKKALEIADISPEKIKRWNRKYGSSAFKKSTKFAKAILQDNVTVIAEIKKASPSAGVIRENLNVESIAEMYGDNGAAAISVVTDSDFFQGELSWLKRVKDRVSLPVIRKDFILDEKQVFESKDAGADAVLLIAAILDETTLNALYGLIYKLGMEVLVEIRSLKELDMALGAGAEIIGINNRNLENFKVGTEEFVQLVNQIPDNKIVVAESGIHKREDLLFIREHGADAVLVGTHLMRSENPGNALYELIKG